MPEATTAPPPAAAPAPAAPAAPAAPQKTIMVSQMPQTATPAAPPKKGSARAEMAKKLREKASYGPPMDEPEQTPSPAVKPDETPVKPAEAEVETPETPEAAPAGKGEVPAEGKDGKKPKVNPWKLVEEYKGKVAKLETEVAEAGKRGIPKPEWDAMQEKLTKTESRAKELEEEIRYVNYQKSDEFKTKYQQPYEAAWSRAMGELKELTVEAGDGNSRAFNQQDLLELVQLPLVKAKQLATEKFGEFANDVMGHRKEILKLYDEQSAALDQAKKNAGEHETQTKAAHAELSKTIGTTWNQANEEAQANDKYGTYFRPVEGDEQGNQRLAKGFELADRAFSENPFAPGLKPDERKSIIQRHAAVRNRAAAFGRLVYQNQQHASRIAELEKELAQYKGSEPDATGRTPRTESSEAPTGMARLRGALEKIAK